MAAQMALALLIAHQLGINVEANAKQMSVDLNDAPMDPKSLFSWVQYHATQVTKHYNIKELVE